MTKTGALRAALIGLVAGATLIYGWAMWRWPHGADTVPDVSYQLIDGRQLTRDDLAGRATLIAFWATNCSSCIREIPHLAQMYREWRDRGLLIIGVAMPYDPPNRVLSMVERAAIPYPVSLDLGGEITRAFGDVSLTPAHVLIDPEGRVLWQRTGILNLELVRSEIEPLLRSDQS